MNDAKIKITKAIAEDTRGIQEVFYQTWLSTYPNEEHGITREDIEDKFKDAFTSEILEKRIKRITHPPEGEVSFVAKDGEKVVGICRVVSSAKENRLQAIYVLPDYQGQGIGQMFWSEARKIFDPKRNIVVSVAIYNTKAIRFYEKLGFKDTGRRFTEEKMRMRSGSVIPEMELETKAK